MEDQGRAAPSIAAVVERYLEDWSAAEAEAGPSGPAPAQDGAWRVRSALLLLAEGFPEHLIHQVLWCSESDARELIDSIRGHFPDAESMGAFLDGRTGKPPSPSPCAKPDEDSSLSLDEDMKQALNMLEYWTDHWLQEYQGKESGGY